MNDRIKELAKQASGGTIWWPQYTDTIDRFVELIVQECLMMADEFELDVNRSGLVDRMKEHFGVE